MISFEPYAVDFHSDALKDWLALDNSVRVQISKKLRARAFAPHVLSDRLGGSLAGCYKIKSSKSGHRLIYEVFDDERVIYVFAVNKREDQKAYRDARQRR